MGGAIYLKKGMVIMNRLSLGQVEWKEFAMVDIFDIVDGYYNKKPPSKEEGKIPFLGATQYSNGITGFYSQEIINNYNKVGELSNKNKNERIYKANCIAITNNGSVGNAYYQSSSFTCSHDVTPIYLKSRSLNKPIALFLIPLLNKAGQSFGYAKKWRPKRMRKSKILLPIDSLGNPNWKFMEDYMRQKEEKLLNSLKNKLKKKIVLNSKEIKPLSECDWKEFFIEDTTEILSGKDIYEKERECGDTPYITSTANNNGIGYFVNNINLTLEENCISVNRNGSVGYAFYHPYAALYSNDTRKLRPKINDPYSAIFLSNMITLQKDKYGYGYKMGTARLKRQKIMLPVNSDNQPDFEYMSNYMKKIESAKIKVYFQKKKLST